MNNIYFIYNFDNPSAIEKIKFLRDNGINVFAFEKDKPVFCWKRVAKKKIKECDYVCVYLLNNRIKKENHNILFEYKYARKHDKQIFFFDATKDDDKTINFLTREQNKVFDDLFNDKFSNIPLEIKTKKFDDLDSTLKWDVSKEISPDKGSEEYSKILLEQYKLMIMTTESLADRRQKTSNLYVTILTALIAFAGSSFGFKNLLMSSVLFIVVGLISIVLSFNWKNTLINFNKNNYGKFAVIEALEKRLPANIFNSEYRFNKMKSILSYSEREKAMTNAFALIGAILFIAGIVLTILVSINIIPLYINS